MNMYAKRHGVIGKILQQFGNFFQMLLLYLDTISVFKVITGDIDNLFPYNRQIESCLLPE